MRSYTAAMRNKSPRAASTLRQLRNVALGVIAILLVISVSLFFLRLFAFALRLIVIGALTGVGVMIILYLFRRQAK
jgi:hypothetical protein